MAVSANEILKTSPLQSRDLPSRIVCDKYMYTTRLGDDEIRITSIGEFSGWQTRPSPDVDLEFRKEAKRQFPQLSAYIDKAITRCGHRPLVSDGILLLGRLSDNSNVYVSCGPGSNGWKLAMGSGEVIARLIDGQSFQEIDKAVGANVETFSPSGRVVHSPMFARMCRARWNV
jgi:glycine/D-amino acid oxidase-like deaminating enzyme